jgi:hypothetical protein
MKHIEIKYEHHYDGTSKSIIRQIEHAITLASINSFLSPHDWLESLTKYNSDNEITLSKERIKKLYPDLLNYFERRMKLVAF